MDSTLTTVPTIVFLLGAALCLIVALYSIAMAPAMNFFLAATSIGLGATSLGGITYAKLSIALQIVSIARVFYVQAVSSLKRYKAHEFATLGSGGGHAGSSSATAGLLLNGATRSQADAKLKQTHRLAGLLLTLLLVLVIKILCESPLFGFTEERVQELRILILQVLLPSILLLTCTAKMGPDQLMGQLKLGAALFSIAYLVPGVAWALVSGGIYAYRMSIYNLDPINSGRLMLLLLLVLAAYLRHPRKQFRVTALVLLPAMAALLFFNNTRQYWLGAVVCGFGYVFLTRKWWVKAATVLGFTCALLVVVGLDFNGEEDRLARVDSESLHEEMVSGRGALWADVFATAMTNPLLGVGFGNYGMSYTVTTPDGETTTARSGAHGVAQDIMAEHGLLLFGLFHLVLLVLIWRMWRGEMKHYPDMFSDMIFWSAMMVPCFFSGTLVNSTPVFGACVMFWCMTKRN